MTDPTTTSADEAKIWDPKATALRWFQYDHLPEDLQPVAGRIYELAEWAHDNLNSSAEKSAGFRKLLEAKDCLVRAKLADRPVILSKEE